MTEIHLFKKDDHEALNDYLAREQSRGHQVQIAQYATVTVASNDQLHGLPPLEQLPAKVNLTAPEPIDGEEPIWLHFKQTESIYWTSDLVAAITT